MNEHRSVALLVETKLCLFLNFFILFFFSSWCKLLTFHWLNLSGWPLWSLQVCLKVSIKMFKVLSLIQYISNLIFQHGEKQNVNVGYDPSCVLKKARCFLFIFMLFYFWFLPVKQFKSYRCVFHFSHLEKHAGQ